MAYREKRINESYINEVEREIAGAYAEAMEEFLSSDDEDLDRFVKRYSGRRDALEAARHTISRLLRRKISINDVAEFMNIDFSALSRDESEMLKDEVQTAIEHPLETIPQGKFDELLRGFLHI